MPSRSPAQARLMAAVAHGWRPSTIKGPPVAVAREFNEADAAQHSRSLSKALRAPSTSKQPKQ